MTPVTGPKCDCGAAAATPADPDKNRLATEVASVLDKFTLMTMLAIGIRAVSAHHKAARPTGASKGWPRHPTPRANSSLAGHRL